ncbi:MAG: hypothetical protein U0996_03460 [Planctomycetaceae bacterium]
MKARSRRSGRFSERSADPRPARFVHLVLGLAEFEDGGICRRRLGIAK